MQSANSNTPLQHDAGTWHTVILDSVAHIKMTGLLLLLTASVVVFATTADNCSGNCNGWRVVFSIVIGVVSAAICLARCMVYLCKPSFNPIGDTLIGAILIAMWIVAAAINTQASSGIFTSTGNGYYATWFALFAAILFSSEALRHATILSRFTQYVHKTSLSLFVVLLVSLVVVGEAAKMCDSHCGNYVAYAVAAGVVSAVACILGILLCGCMDHEAWHTSWLLKALGLFLVVWWAVGAGLNTNKHGAFPSTVFANGYYATWAALAASIVFLASRLAPPNVTPSSLVSNYGNPGNPNYGNQQRRSSDVDHNTSTTTTTTRAQFGA